MCLKLNCAKIRHFPHTAKEMKKKNTNGFTFSFFLPKADARFVFRQRFCASEDTAAW